MFNFNLERVFKFRAGYFVMYWRDRFNPCGLDVRAQVWHCQCPEGTHG